MILALLFNKVFQYIIGVIVVILIIWGVYLYGYSSRQDEYDDQIKEETHVQELNTEKARNLDGATNCAILGGKLRDGRCIK